jgi:hypothetical protein
VETPNNEKTREMALKAAIFVFVLFAVVECLASFLHLHFDDPLLLSGIVAGALKNLLFPERKRSCILVIESDHLEELRLAVGDNPDVHFPQSTTEALRIIKTTAPEKSGAVAIGKILSGSP